MEVEAEAVDRRYNAHCQWALEFDVPVELKLEGFS